MSERIIRMREVSFEGKSIKGASSGRKSLGLSIALMALFALVFFLDQPSATAEQPEESSATWGKVLIIGGNTFDYGVLASTELYDPATNTFAPANQTASMNTERVNATATLITTGPNAGKVLIAGGIGNRTGVLASTELYDPTTNTFAPPDQTASMNYERVDAT
ncbi:MAG TPA: kelch repeat-containing protein, partial [Candidatus Binataceae bacterium]|nr:kelch repeat-containing protein [Candidatus Binataceae bacterium]